QAGDVDDVLDADDGAPQRWRVGPGVHRLGVTGRVLRQLGPGPDLRVVRLDALLRGGDELARPPSSRMDLLQVVQQPADTCPATVHRWTLLLRSPSDCRFTITQ